MSTTSAGGPPADLPELKNRPLAGALAWLVPGAGHIYQGRHGKGVVFLVCILGTFLYGIYLGGPHTVYAAFPTRQAKVNLRLPTQWPFFCQAGVGAPAVVALVQFVRARDGRPALFSGFLAPPLGGNHDPQNPHHIDRVHADRHRYYELGSVYTMVAGLLNILAVYDACCGPFVRPRPQAADEEEEAGQPKSSPAGAQAAPADTPS